MSIHIKSEPTESLCCAKLATFVVDHIGTHWKCTECGKPCEVNAPITAKVDHIRIADGAYTSIDVGGDTPTWFFLQHDDGTFEWNPKLIEAFEKQLWELFSKRLDAATENTVLSHVTIGLLKQMAKYKQPEPIQDPIGDGSKS